MKSDITFANNTEYSNEINLAKWKDILEGTISDGGFWVREIRMLFTATLAIVFVVGVCGNLLTCVVIYCHRSMHTATNYYLFNMAGSDLLVAFGIFIDLNGYNNYPYHIDAFGDIVCKINFFLVGVLWNNSVLTITALAIERFIVIWYPLLLNREQEWQRVTKIICFIWATAIIETVPEIFTVNLVQSKSFSVCFIVPTTFAKQLNAVLALMTFIIPLGIMILMYTMVAFKVNGTEISCNHSRHIFNHGNSTSKVNKLIIALTVSFIVCWLPFFALRIVICRMEVHRYTWIIKNWEVLLMLTSFNSWFSIVLNPLLFSLISTKFRHALKALWKAKFKRQHLRQRNMVV